MPRMSGNEDARYIQLSHLPSLAEVDHASLEPLMKKMLAKSIAIQLKPMSGSTQMSHFAFDHLINLAEEQLNILITGLYKISLIQRRREISKSDMRIWLQGFGLELADLYTELQQSQFIKQKFRGANEILTERAQQSAKTPDESDITVMGNQGKKIEESIVLPSNPLQDRVPGWLPPFPADHTYKFTAQYNHPITEETLIRKQLVKEGKESEKALVHLSTAMGENQDISTKPEHVAYDKHLAQEELSAIYTNHLQDTWKNRISFFHDNEYHSKKLNIEEYAYKKVELARRKVKEYEVKQLHLQKDPFIQMSRIIVSSDSTTDKRTTNKKIREYLKRSYSQLIDSVEDLEKERKAAIAEAELEKEKQLAKWTVMREEKLKQQQQKTMQENNDILNLSELAADGTTAFFTALESSDDESESQRPILPPIIEDAPANTGTILQDTTHHNTDTQEVTSLQERTITTFQTNEPVKEEPIKEQEEPDDDEEGTNFLFDDVDTISLPNDINI